MEQGKKQFKACLVRFVSKAQIPTRAAPLTIVDTNSDESCRFIFLMADGIFSFAGSFLIKTDILARGVAFRHKRTFYKLAV